MIEFSIKYFENKNFKNKKIEKDFLKKLVMKIIQLLLSYNNIYEYTKIGLAKKLEDKYNIENYEKNALYYLSRGNLGNENNNFIGSLFSYYIYHYIEYKNIFNNKKKIILNNETLLKIEIEN